MLWHRRHPESAIRIVTGEVERLADGRLSCPAEVLQLRVVPELGDDVRLPLERLVPRVGRVEHRLLVGVFGVLLTEGTERLRRRVGRERLRKEGPHQLQLEVRGDLAVGVATHGRGAGRVGLRRRRRDDASAYSGIGGKDAEVADEVGLRGRDECGETAKEGHRRQDEVRLPGGGGPLHPVGEATIGQSREPLEGEWSARPVGAESLEAHDVLLVNPGVGMEPPAGAGRPARGLAFAEPDSAGEQSQHRLLRNPPAEGALGRAVVRQATT